VKLIRTLVGASGSPDRERTTLSMVDLRQTALVETDQPAQLASIIGHPGTDPSESLTITKAEPQSVVLEATLTRPGLVILADVYYPGWRLLIDGSPAPILRTNRLMRGATVPAGKHRLEYNYQSESFRIGLFVSLAGLIVLVVVYSWAARGS